MQILLFFLFARPIGAARLPKFAHRRIVRISADRVESKPDSGKNRRDITQRP